MAFRVERENKRRSGEVIKALWKAKKKYRKEFAQSKANTQSGKASSWREGISHAPQAMRIARHRQYKRVFDCAAHSDNTHTRKVALAQQALICPGEKWRGAVRLTQNGRERARENDRNDEGKGEVYLL